MPAQQRKHIAANTKMLRRPKLKRVLSLLRNIRQNRRLCGLLLLLGLFFCLVLGWQGYRVIYHPDIRATAVHFVVASSTRNFDDIYSCVDDKYHRQLSPTQSKLFLSQIEPYLPSQMTITQIQSRQFISGDWEYNTLVTYNFPQPKNKKGKFTLTLGYSKERGWKVHGLNAFRSLFMTMYGMKGVKYIDAAFAAATESPR